MRGVRDASLRAGPSTEWEEEREDGRWPLSSLSLSLSLEAKNEFPILG